MALKWREFDFADMPDGGSQFVIGLEPKSDE